MTALRLVKSLKFYPILIAAAKLVTGAIAFPTTQIPLAGVCKDQLLRDDTRFSGALNPANVVTRFTIPGKFGYSVSYHDESGCLVRQYGRAAANGNIGLLANSQTAGLSFHCLAQGDQVTVTFRNGSSRVFIVSHILQFRATDPSDFSKPFIDEQGNTITANDLFNKAYNPNGLTFQKCLFGNGSWTWGILIVQARQRSIGS
jgi:hypothetical protein